MNVQDICKILITIGALSLIVSIIYALFRSLSIAEDYMEHKKNTKEYEIAYTYFINKNAEDFSIDNIIQEVFDNYIMKKGLINRKISEDYKRILIQEISKEVADNASPFMLKYISMTYRDIKLSELIYDKVTLLVCALASKNNTI